mmetsp:Transcript_114164/g.227188  ORF Transcript_114164/g.227188 Transcript_114164/m.227188 type:complete len:254 (+) Transcript_114164:138-899(+)
MYSDFDWANAPLSSASAPIVSGVAYLIMVAILPRFVPPGGVKGIKGILALHNGILSVWSFLMFAGCLAEMFRRAQHEGNWDWMFCESPHRRATGPLYFWSYVFYVSKYYEMLDTVLALLRGSKPPHFGLHVYHHSLVPVMIWNWHENCMSLQFPGLLFNTLVHVVMYAYYTFKIFQWPTPWKSWVTRLQIIQFVTSFAFMLVTLSRYANTGLSNDQCSGMMTLWANLVLNVTLLWQFLGVLFSNVRSAHQKKV